MNKAVTADGSFDTEEFRRGVIVLLTLNSPREKFWGMLLSVSTAGVTMHGIPLESFEDLVRQVRAEEAVGLSTVFFPLHRLERIALDLPSGEMPSLAEQFASRTGRPADTVFKAGAQR